MNKPIIEVPDQVKVLNSIRILTRAYFDYQKERMRLDGMLGIKKDGELKKLTPPRDETFLAELFKRKEEVAAMETAIHKELAKEVHKHLLWKGFLKGVKGVGEGIAAVIISQIEIGRAKYPSSLWRFAGVAPGKDKRKKGEKNAFNAFLKMVLVGRLGPSFLKSNSPYREYYDNMRVRLDGEDWGVPSKAPSDPKHPKAFHQHNAANRYMVKMFLKDLYFAWRSLEGLPISEGYQEAYLGHKHGVSAGE